MRYKTLISAQGLLQNVNKQDWIVVDCRFSLADAEAGFKAYRHGHLPGARYADLNKDLSGQITDYTGRHPLPNFSQLARKLGEWGIDNHTQVVAYDDAGGVFASRLWWLLRWLGHYQVAVLDGGLTHWKKLGYPLTTVLPILKPVIFRPYPGEDSGLTAIQVENGLAQKQLCLIDARAAERFHGQQEPMDSVAGHIPGALSRPFQSNLDKDGLFFSSEKLQSQFNQLIGNKSSNQVAHMCGSGVTACHNLLAMEIAGLTGSKLYPGSWSEWIRNKNRSVTK